MKHKAWIKTYERDFERLAEEIGDLRYDSLAEFLNLLGEKIKRDGNSDRDRGRRHLAEALHEAKDKIVDAAESVDQAWRICAPYMLPADIMEKIESEFKTKEEKRQALKLLLNINKRDDLKGDSFQVERCALFNTHGDLETLRRNVAFDDPRGIILDAEYEGNERVRDLNFPFGTAERYNEGDEFPGPPDNFPF